jgi:glycosyltransferase involved in cell wall biosynthesis
MNCVDVVIPCYNYGRYLRACVDSVLSQRGVNVRVLVIDDCSSDSTPEVASELTRFDARVEYRRHDLNRGHIATYNEGLLEWANSDFCMLLSADDMLAAGALGRAVALMNSHPEIGMVFGDAPKTYQPEDLFYSTPECATYATHVYERGAFLELMCREAWNMVPTPTAVVRTAVQRKIGGYRPELPHSGDMEMWLRCAAHSRVGVIDGVQAFYRLHTTQMSSQYVGITDFIEVKAAFDFVFAEYGQHMDDLESLRRKAVIGLADRAFWTAAKLFDSGHRDRCQPYLDFAVALHPELRRQSYWRALRYKRLIGPGLWAKFAPLVRRLRGQQASALRRDRLTCV